MVLPVLPFGTAWPLQTAGGAWRRPVPVQSHGPRRQAFGTRVCSHLVNVFFSIPIRKEGWKRLSLTGRDSGIIYSFVQQGYGNCLITQSPEIGIVWTHRTRPGPVMSVAMLITQEEQGRPLRRRPQRRHKLSETGIQGPATSVQVLGFSGWGCPFPGEGNCCIFYLSTAKKTVSGTPRWA